MPDHKELQDLLKGAFQAGEWERLIRTNEFMAASRAMTNVDDVEKVIEFGSGLLSTGEESF